MRNLLITLLFGLFCGHLFSQNVLDAKEKQALIDLYNQCNGKEWSSSYLWNLSDSPSSWAGITIKDGHVVEIDLWNAQLKGELPESLGNLKELTKLELSSNAISGNLPKSIFVLPKLKILNLSMQNVRGERTLKSNLPDEINLPECVYFILNKNALKGNLSKKVYMPQVKQIVLDDNNLEGPLKSEWCNFPMLEAYTLSNNNFKGNCEFNFEKTPKLRELFLGGATKGNKGLTGSLPQSIYKLDLLQLEVQNTSIGGNIDERIANWKNIKNLLLFGSKFSGPFPKALEKLENLEILNLAGGNTLEGPLPDLSKLRKLRNLLLSGNNISGQIPSFFSKMTWLRELRMGECNLSGNLPDFLAPKYGEDDDYIEGLCSCRELDLSANKLEGTIPESWSNFKYLVTLNVRKNNLEGNPIPTTGVTHYKF